MCIRDRIQVQPVILSWIGVVAHEAWAHYFWQILKLSRELSSPSAFLLDASNYWPWVDLQSIITLSAPQTSLRPPSFSWLFPTLRSQYLRLDHLSAHLPPNLSNSKNPSYCMACRCHSNFKSATGLKRAHLDLSGPSSDTRFIMIITVADRRFPPLLASTPTCYHL